MTCVLAPGGGRLETGTAFQSEILAERKIIESDEINLIIKKTLYGTCEQQRHRSACIYADTCLRCNLAR